MKEKTNTTKRHIYLTEVLLSYSSNVCWNHTNGRVLNRRTCVNFQRLRSNPEETELLNKQRKIDFWEVICYNILWIGVEISKRQPSFELIADGHF